MAVFSSRRLLKDLLAGLQAAWTVCWWRRVAVRRASCRCRLARERFILMVVVVVEVVLGDRPVSTSDKLRGIAEAKRRSCEGEAKCHWFEAV